MTKHLSFLGNKLTKILDFGMHPFADTFVSEHQLYKSEPVLPLECFVDFESGLIQLGCISNDYDRYNQYEYSYTSSNSKVSRKHWDDFYNTMCLRFNPNKNFIIEIGSNDGYLLEKFHTDNTILGIDASKEMVNQCNYKGIRSINEVFNKAVAVDVRKQYGICDFIIANNVFNHSNNPIDFAAGVFELLSHDGIFIFEMPYWGTTVSSGKFDQIYHEHITYFTVKSAYNILRAAGLTVIDVDFVDYHGGSIRVTAKKEDSVRLIKKIKELILLEEFQGLFFPYTYVKWMDKIKSDRIKFLNKLYKIKEENPNVPIIGVGAAAKANTLLNYYSLNNSVIDYITDSSPNKQGKYTPLSRIPIVSDDIFKNYDKVYALILSWNIQDSLKETLSSINSNIEYITL